MNIALIAPLGFALKEPFAGGLEMMLSALATGLARRGHDVTLFAREGSRCEGVTLDVSAHSYLEEGTWRADFTRQQLSYEQANEFHTYMRIMNTLRKAGARFSLVHNHSMYHLPPCLAHTLPVPFLTTLHIPPLVFFRHGMRHGAQLGLQYYVAVSRHLARSWRDDLPNVHVIHNGIHVAQWSAPPTPEPRPERVFWAGRFCKEKAPHLAIDAALKAGYAIELAGPVYEQGYFDAEIVPRLARPGVYLLGHLTQKELARHMSRARCVLFTSMWHEPFGLILAEALASGTPVAAFDSGAASEVLCEDTGVIVPRGDVDALAGAILAVQGLEPAACMARAHAHFSLDHMLDEYEQYYAYMCDDYARRCAARSSLLTSQKDTPCKPL